MSDSHPARWHACVAFDRSEAQPLVPGCGACRCLGIPPAEAPTRHSQCRRPHELSVHDALGAKRVSAECEASFHTRLPPQLGRRGCAAQQRPRRESMATTCGSALEQRRLGASDLSGRLSSGNTFGPRAWIGHKRDRSSTPPRELHRHLHRNSTYADFPAAQRNAWAPPSQRAVPRNAAAEVSPRASASRPAWSTTTCGERMPHHQVPESRTAARAGCRDDTRSGILKTVSSEQTGASGQYRALRGRPWPNAR